MKKLFILLTVFIINAHAQHSQWFPDNLNIHPFTANFLEPKLGFAFHTGSDNLRLDISNSRDLYLLNREDPLSSEKKVYNILHFSVGADFFTLTRLRREDEFHFPVETIDYLFGLNAGYRVEVKRKGEPIPNTNRIALTLYEYGFRFRLSHISAHLVDGKYDYKLNGWRDNDHPHVYSREFIELFPYIQLSSVRIYAGFTYLIHVTPKEIGKDIYQLGFDYFASDVLPNNMHPFIAYDFKLNHVSKYSGNNTISAGIKFGYPWNPGLSIQYSYISGKSIHGEYFDRNENYSTIGLNIDL